jgi:GAF domain-containing protein
MLERLDVCYRGSATILQARGRAIEAARALRFASRTNLILDEPRAVERMHAAARAVLESSQVGPLLDRALAGALALSAADFANIQLRDTATDALRIAAHTGFDADFLEHFAVVDDATSACGRAAFAASQITIVDVDHDESFAPHREIAARSGFRAVQSTPLVDPDGRTRGIISTHFRRPHRPSDRDAEIMRWYAEKISAALAQRAETWQRDAAPEAKILNRVGLQPTGLAPSQAG